MSVRSVNYLQFTHFTHDEVKQNEELEDRPIKQQEKAHLGLPIY